MRCTSTLPLPEALGSIAMLTLIGVAALLWSFAPGLHHEIIQEDGPVEWATFWSFLLAGIFAFRALAEGPIPARPWRSLYLVAFGMGCLAIAGEEISWAQRLLTYRPPEAFLAENF